MILKVVFLYVNNEINKWGGYKTTPKLNQLNCGNNMKYLTTIFISLAFLAANLFSQDLSEWENCTEGLNTYNTAKGISKIDTILFITYDYTYLSKNYGEQWHTIKYYDNFINQIKLARTFKMIKFKNKYIMFKSTTNSYISEDLQNWESIKIEGFGKGPSFVSIFSTDSTIIVRTTESDTISQYRTHICNEITNDSIKTLKFQKIPGDGEIVDNNEDFGKSFSNVTNYYQFGDTLYAIYYNGSKLFYYPRYFYSTDFGWSWKKVDVNIQGGIKSLSKINGKLWILSPFAIWQPKEDGTYEKIVDEQFDNFNTDFLIEHKGMIYAQAIDSLNHKAILVRKKDGETKWEIVGNRHFTLLQLISTGNLLIASNQSYGVLVSTDDGVTWEERNNGLYYSPDYLYEGPWKKIVKINDNEYITAPRNRFYNVYMKSYDGGKSWQRKFVIDSIGYTEYNWTGVKYNFTFSKNKYGLFAADRGTNKTYKSYDKGESWEFYSDVSAFFLDEDKNMYERNDTLFYFYNDRNFATYKYIYYSLDTGRTWVMYDSLFLQKLPEKSNFLFVRDGNYYSINYKSFALFKSIDDGKIWNFERQISKMTSDTLNYQSVYSYVENKDTILILANLDSIIRQPIYITKDFGRTFIQTNFPKINGKNIAEDNKFLYLNGKLILLLLGFQNSESNLFEFDEEKNEWINIAQNLDGNIITDILSVENYLYISTIEGLFRMRVDPVSVKEEIEKVTLLPIELYPNPSSGIVKLQNNYYNLTNLQIFDIYGREQQASNFSNEQFDVSGLQAGVYIVKLTFDNSWFITRKFIKM